MFGEKRIIDEGAMLRAQDEIQQRNRDAYQRALQNVKDSYKAHESSIYGDNPFVNAMTWIVNGMSGQGNENDYLKTHGFSDELKAAGESGNLDASDLYSYLGNVERGLTKEAEKGTLATAGVRNIPIIGGILDYLIQPAAQLGAAGRDLYTGTSEGNWDAWNKRDHLSDAAALGQVAASAFMPGAAKASPLSHKIALSALTGAADNTLDYLRQNGYESDAGGLLSNAGIGALFGGGFAAAGGGLNALSNRGANALGDLANGASKGTLYGAGLRDLGMSAANKWNGMSKMGKAATIGAGVGGSFALKNLLGGNNNNDQYQQAAYGNNYIGEY